MCLPGFLSKLTSNINSRALARTLFYGVRIGADSNLSHCSVDVFSDTRGNFLFSEYFSQANPNLTHWDS